MTSTIEAVRAKYDGTLEAGQETDDVVGVAGRVLFIRNAGGLCFVQLAAGDGTTIQAMLSKKQIGADSSSSSSSSSTSVTTCSSKAV